MGKAKAKPKQGQPATTAAERSRQNRDKVAIGHDDTTDHRLLQSGRLAREDHLLDRGARSRLNEATLRGLKRVAARTAPGERPDLQKAKQVIASEAENSARQAEPEGAPVNPAGVRHVADPFDLLRNRNLLDRKDPAMNATLWFAGDRYRKYWHASGMCGVAAMDLTRAVVDGGSSAGGMPSSDYAMDCRKKLREANAVIGPRHAALFCAIVLHGQTIASQRHMIFDSEREKTADLIALERLRDCLHRLCDLWGMRPRREGRIVVQGDAEHQAAYGTWVVGQFQI